MHPRVLRNAPGPCPECGMALENINPADDSSLISETRSMTRRFILAASCALIVVLLHHLPLPHFSWNPYIQLVLAVIASPVAASVIYARAFSAAADKRANMFTLLALGMGAALLFSALSLFFPSLIGETRHFSAAAAVAALSLGGQALELKARRSSGSAVRSLLNLLPQYAALVQKDGSEISIPLRDVQPDNVLRVKPGQHVPADGIIVNGRSSIDESLLTGEPLPIPKKPNDPVVGGSLNHDGSFLMRVTRVGEESAVGSIARAAQHALASQPAAQRLADAVGSLLVPLAVIAALAAFLLHLPDFHVALSFGVNVLVIACPCALGLAAPVSIVVAAGRAAQLGVAFRNAQAVETLAKTSLFALDKTGTLSLGKPTLLKFVVAPDFSKDLALSLAASVSRPSEHPLAAAVLTYAQKHNAPIPDPHDFLAIPGAGASAVVDNQPVVIGSREALRSQNVPEDSLDSLIQSLSPPNNASFCFLAVNQRPVAACSFHDPLRQGAASAVSFLQRLPADVSILTGDAEKPALAVADALSIPHNRVHSRLSPTDKAAQVSRQKSQGKIVAMVGDGVNDAPALAAANVGVAVASGSPVASETADVTLVKGGVETLPRAVAVAKAARSNILQNLAFACLYNALALPIAAGVFPAVSLTPEIAAAAMSLSSLCVILNALRLKRLKAP